MIEPGLITPGWVFFLLTLKRDIWYDLCVMKLILLKILLCISFACLLVQIAPLGAPDEMKSHLDEFSRFNVTHHDNLGDKVHSHKHKHSEDGDEHEHNHEHSRIVQTDFRILCNSHRIIAKVKIVEITNGFREKNLISNPHPFEVFRPPIS